MDKYYMLMFEKITIFDWIYFYFVTFLELESAFFFHHY
jgi:hypothetical protein